MLRALSTGLSTVTELSDAVFEFCPSSTKLASSVSGAGVMEASPSELTSISNGPFGGECGDCTPIASSLGALLSRAPERELLSRFFIRSLHLSKGVRVSSSMSRESRGP